MNILQNEIINTRKIYRDLFKNAQIAIDKQIDSLKKASLCNKCKENCDINFNEISVTQKFPSNCRYRFWQEAALDLLENKISKDILEKISAVDAHRENFSCQMCGSCCKLASSEFSFEQLQERAKNGDKFSKDFVSVFVPYKSEEEAKNAFPEYFELLNDVVNDGRIYYYYCPKLVGNSCSDYENRPDICKDFPHNPLKLLPSTCSFNAWKNDIAKQSMLLKAKTDIIEFYKTKLG